MIIHSVKLCNYKSIGDIDNEIIIENGVTTIIGKNESGKSNILDGLSKISFTETMVEAFRLNNKNRSLPDGISISYVIVMQFTEDEKKKFQISTNTTIEIFENEIKTEGGIQEYFEKYVRESFELMIEFWSDTIKVQSQNTLT